MSPISVSSFFQLPQRQNSITRELCGAIATFLTMAYILAVNPIILANAGLNKSSTVSIAHGIGYGFVLFVAIKILKGRPWEVKPLMYAVAAAFAAYFFCEKNF